MNTRRILMLCVWLFAITFTRAQVPQAISYQAVARDLTGKVLSEKPISVQVEILRGSNAGTVVYTETHELTTTKTGTINLLIGGGDKVGESDFSTIDWSQSPYFLRLGLRQEKESEYMEVVNTQMVSVPYALYAEKAGVAGSVSGGGSAGTITKADFTITPEDMQDECHLLYSMLSGGIAQDYATVATDENTQEKYMDATNGFNLVYLTGRDLELSAEIEGEDGVVVEKTKYYSPSSERGRYCSFWIKCKPKSLEDPTANTYSLSIVIKDKDGNEICRYPFTYQFTNIPYSL